MAAQVAILNQAVWQGSHVALYVGTKAQAWFIKTAGRIPEQSCFKLSKLKANQKQGRTSDQSDPEIPKPAKSSTKSETTPTASAKRLERDLDRISIISLSIATSVYLLLYCSHISNWV
jgi:hypothetical protein